MISYQCPTTFNDRWLVETVFPNLKNGFFVEAGAADGCGDSTSWILEKEFEWSGILVEPNKDFYDNLVLNRKSICINKALYDKTGTIKYLSAVNKYYSGIVTEFGDGHKTECYKDGYIEYDVESISLNDVLLNNGVPTHINFILLDTEGSEYKILSTLNFSKFTIDVFIVELSNEMSAEILKSVGYRQVFNKFNKNAPWETYWFRKDFNPF